MAKFPSPCIKDSIYVPYYPDPEGPFQFLVNYIQQVSISNRYIRPVRSQSSHHVADCWCTFSEQRDEEAMVVCERTKQSSALSWCFMHE
jgi:hypothetical protein